MLKKTFRSLLWIVAGFICPEHLFVILYRFVPVPVTPLMIIRYAEQRKEDKNATIYHRWVPLEKISDHLKRAVVASEDQRFFEHRGFDLEQIKRARKENMTRRRPRGASTISQQTAKNLFLWPRSSWFRKGLEVYFTFLIEVLWSKERILEVYLNSIEMGKGIYGAEAVARVHFNTTPLRLTREQAALVAATLPNPRRFSSRNPSAYVLRRKQEILRQMDFIDLPRAE